MLSFTHNTTACKSQRAPSHNHTPNPRSQLPTTACHPTIPWAPASHHCSQAPPTQTSMRATKHDRCAWTLQTSSGAESQPRLARPRPLYRPASCRRRMRATSSALCRLAAGLPAQRRVSTTPLWWPIHGTVLRISGRGGGSVGAGRVRGVSELVGMHWGLLAVSGVCLWPCPIC